MNMMSWQPSQGLTSVSNVFISNQLFSFSSDKDRRTDSRIRRKKKTKTAQPRRESNPGSCELFVGAEREELIRNDPDKSEFVVFFSSLAPYPVLLQELHDVRRKAESTQILTQADLS